LSVSILGIRGSSCWSPQELIVDACFMTGESNGCPDTEMVVSNESERVTHSMKIDNSCFERVDVFKYLGTSLTN